MQIKKENKKLNKVVLPIGRQGFTLIEILIVTVIAGMVFVAIYSFYASIVKFNTESRYEIVASNLAQEGVEIIRNRRDQNVLRGIDWRYELDDQTCYPTMQGGPSCNGIGDINLGGVTFTRTCVISGNMTVVCTVVWDSIAKSGTRSAEATSILTDWYKPSLIP